MRLQPFTGWPPEAITWFAGLAADNSRAWFQANRRTYDEAVRGPLEWLLAEVADELGDGKVFRPNRDTRFSADKAPYKLAAYAVIERPGGSYYVQLRQAGLFVGGGLYAPERARLAAVRQAIAQERSGRRLQRIVDDLAAHGIELLRDGALKTAPRGYPTDHPRIELLRLPGLAGGHQFGVEPWLSTAQAKDVVLAGWHDLDPLLAWLAKIEV